MVATAPYGDRAIRRRPGLSRWGRGVGRQDQKGRHEAHDDTDPQPPRTRTQPHGNHRLMATVRKVNSDAGRLRSMDRAASKTATTVSITTRRRGVVALEEGLRYLPIVATHRTGCPDPVWWRRRCPAGRCVAGGGSSGHLGEEEHQQKRRHVLAAGFVDVEACSGSGNPVVVFGGRVGRRDGVGAVGVRGRLDRIGGGGQ